MTISGRHHRRAAHQVRLVSGLLAVRAVRRLAHEAGLGSVGRRWLVGIGVTLAVVGGTLVVLLGQLVALLVGRTDTGLATLLGAAAALLVVAPWVVGTLGVGAAAACHADPSHTLFRPAFVGPVVPVLARTGIPTLLKAVVSTLALLALALPALRTAGAGPALTALVALVAVVYAVTVTAVRLLLLGWRLQSVARLRHGRLGLPLVVGTVALQGTAAFLVPHLVAGLGARPDLPAAAAALGAHARAVDARTAATALAVLLVLLPVEATLGVRALARGLDLVERELRLAAGRIRAQVAAAPPLPADPLRALVAKDVRRARRAAGPLVGPALATTAWGCVLACALLGVVTSGLLPGRDNPLLLGFQLLVSALVAIEFASAGLRPITSPDADGAAARTVLAVPGGRRLSVRAKATLHARVLSAVAVVTLGTLGLVADISVGGVLALVALLVGGIVLSTLEHVGAPAVHPRLDWTSIEQIGGNPRAQALGMTVSVAGFVVLNTVATALVAVESTLPGRTAVLLLLVVVAAVLAPRLARSTTTIFFRRFT